MEMFEFLKPCTIEPRNKAEMKQAMEKYYDDVKGDKGGALFAVCRGKVICYRIMTSSTFFRCWHVKLS